MTNKTAWTGLRLTDLDFEFIRNEAKKRGISMSRYLRELIKKEQAK